MRQCDTPRNKLATAESKASRVKCRLAAAKPPLTALDRAVRSSLAKGSRHFPNNPNRLTGIAVRHVGTPLPAASDDDSLWNIQFWNIDKCHHYMVVCGLAGLGAYAALAPAPIRPHVRSAIRLDRFQSRSLIARLVAAARDWVVAATHGGKLPASAFFCDCDDLPRALFHEEADQTSNYYFPLGAAEVGTHKFGLSCAAGEGYHQVTKGRRRLLDQPRWYLVEARRRDQIGKIRRLRTKRREAF
ncbi:hypothetical protein EDB87DRAFT_1736686 [Lactarius vividus]|nr:hypothetical protein EDB87DRAFT_1736686 [Lactarius vividus]